MLVWLASYPRSGNTLLRQVLKSCFDLSSCEGLEPVPSSFRTPDGIRDEFYGSYFVEGDPEDYYRRSRNSPELVLIKSHQLPRDNAKAIYVVRDGRLALKSYAKYQDTYHPGTSSFDSLLLGDHAYGEWTSHHHAWCERRAGETLVIRFEELVQADDSLLARIAGFLDLPGLGRPWVNPQAELRTLNPAFFGNGKRIWQPDEFWTPSRLRQFYTLHGPLLVRLGYASAAEVLAGAYPPGSDEERLLRSAHDLAARQRDLQAVCDDRRAEIDLLAKACAERRAEIDLLTKACAEHRAALDRLQRECKTRGDVIRNLDQLCGTMRDQVAALDAQAQAAESRARELEARLLQRRSFSGLLRLIRG